MDVQSKPPRGFINPQSIDSKFGRRWLKKGEDKKPVLYSRIGEQLRNPKLHRTICRWVIGAPNWRKLLSNQYRKRWPMYRGLRIGLFTEFALKSYSARNFFETAHTLPFHGVGGTFWRGSSQPSGDHFLLDRIDYSIRPWKGEALGDLFMNHMRIRKDVAPLGKSVGKWNFSPPKDAVRLHYRPPFPDRSVPYSS